MRLLPLLLAACADPVPLAVDTDVPDDTATGAVWEPWPTTCPELGSAGAVATLVGAVQVGSIDPLGPSAVQVVRDAEAYAAVDAVLGGGLPKVDPRRGVVVVRGYRDASTCGWAPVRGVWYAAEATLAVWERDGSRDCCMSCDAMQTEVAVWQVPSTGAVDAVCVTTTGGCRSRAGEDDTDVCRRE